MARASTAAENAALAGLSGTGSTNVIPYMSLHTADPGTTGTNEYAGVTRQAVSWNAPSGGSMTNSSSLTFSTSGASAVTYFGLWSLATSGVFALGGALASSVTAASISFAAGAVTISMS